MKKHIFFGMVVFLITTLSLSVQNQLFAQFIKIDTSFYSPSLKQTRNVTVFLPDEYYKDQDEHFSTIYYLHGWGGNHQSLDPAQVRLDQLLESGAIRPVIIICADHSSLPFGSGVYVNSPLTGNFEDFAAFDIVEWVESSFRAMPEKNARALFGQSLGAYGAFWLAIQHKDRFRAISSHAGHINNEVWLPAARIMIILENGQPPYYYDFFGFSAELPEIIPGFFTMSMFLAASGFSPNQNSPQTYINPRIVDYPFNEWGLMIDSVYNKWKTFDIGHKINELNAADSVSILLGCGTNDETLAYYPNLTIRDSLIHYNLSFEFFSHKGGHSMPDVYFDRSMIFLDSLLMHPSIFTPAHNLSKHNELAAFPNPAKDMTSICLLPGESDIIVSISDIGGAYLPQANYSEIISDQKLTLKLKERKNGVYIIHFRSNKRTGNIKIIITA